MPNEFMTLVDSHCHLPLIDGGPEGMDGIVQRALAVGIEHMLCVSVDLESCAAVIAAAKRYACVSASIGVHPNTDESAEEPSVDDLVRRAAAPEIVAIGETGLDYFRSEGDLEWQRQRFRTHIAAAGETKKPLIIHCREAADDMLAILREQRADTIGGVMHCFVESWDVAQAALDLGFYISLSGIVTFKNAHALKEVAQKVPLNRLLVETDSPWLAPMPMRGKQNEPAYVCHTAAYVAGLRDMDPHEFAASTTQNFYDLFGVVA